MAKMQFFMKKDDAVTPVPNAFIDYYMPKANPAFVTVYLYGFRNCYHDNFEVDSACIADALDMLESDVIRAWRHWQEQGIVEMTTGDDGDVSISYLLVRAPKDTEDNDYTHTQMQSDEKLNTTQNAESGGTSRVLVEKKPEYSTQEMDLYIKNSESVRKLFESASKHLGKILSYNDMSVLFSFHDWLRMPVEVIEILLSHCASNNHRSMRYIEKVALDWADRGISTQESAKEHIRLYNTDFKEIMKNMGIKNRDPVETEEAYMVKWLKVMKMPMSVVTEACKKAVMQTGKASYPYADKIIEGWFENKVQTLDDIKKLEDAYSAGKKTQESEGTTQQRGRQKTKVNRFVNYEQRTDWDFERLKELDREFLDKELEG